MTKHDLDEFKKEILNVLRNETHDAIKHTGKSWVKDTARATVEQTVPITIEATLLRLGLDTTKPIESQEDFAYLRKARNESEDRRKIIMGAITRWGVGIFIAAASAGASLWSAMQHKP